MIGIKQKIRFYSKEIIVLLLIFAYMIARAIIYAKYPVESESDWAQRDLIMNFPRTGGVIAVLFLLKQKFRFVSLNSLLNIDAKMIFAMFLVLILPTFTPLFVGTYIVPTSLLLTLTISSLFVAVFEEVLFRWGLYDLLTEKLGWIHAMVISSFVFSVFHLQAQPLHALPSLFIYGVIFCLLRLNGVSLFWLILLHFVFDSAVFLFIPTEEVPSAWLAFELVYLSGLSLGIYKMTDKRRLHLSRESFEK